MNRDRVNDALRKILAGIKDAKKVIDLDPKAAHLSLKLYTEQISEIMESVERADMSLPRLNTQTRLLDEIFEELSQCAKLIDAALIKRAFDDSALNP